MIYIPAKPITFDTGKQSAEIAGRFPSTPCTTDPHLLEAQNVPASSTNRKRVKHDANFYRRIGSADEKIRIDICVINMSLLDMQNGKGFLGALTASFMSGNIPASGRSRELPRQRIIGFDPLSKPLLDSCQEVYQCC